MYYEIKSYELTPSDKVLVEAMSEVLFDRKNQEVDLPFIMWDLSCESLPGLMMERESQTGSPQNVSEESLPKFDAPQPESDKPHPEQKGLGKAQGGSVFDSEVLGYYSPRNYTITLLEKPIADAALRLDCNPDILRSIVLMHEIGHYITQCPANVLYPHWKNHVQSHLAFWKDSEFMLECAKRSHHVASAEFIENSSTLYLETMAQLFIHLIVRDRPEYYEVFKKLTAEQSGTYTHYLKYVNDIDAWHLERAMYYLRDTDYRNLSYKCSSPFYIKDKDLEHIF